MVLLMMLHPTQELEPPANPARFNLFANSKLVQVISKVLDTATDKDSIILDSFAGSGTTAHAVLEANKRDGPNWQMPDHIWKTSAWRADLGMLA